MAWKRAHERADRAVSYFLICRKCGCETLGVMAAEDAEALVVAHDEDRHGKVRRKKTDAENLLAEFLRSRKASCSPATARYYSATLAPFFAWMGKRAIRTWGRHHVTAWIEKHPEWKPRTTQKFLVCVRTVRTWAVEQRHYDVPDFAGSLKAPRVKRRRVTPLAPAHVSALLRVAREHPWLELPVALAAYAGLSLGDVRGLEWADVRWEEGRIQRDRQKSGRALDVKIGAGLRDVLSRHRALSGPVCRGLPTSDTGFAKAVRDLYARAKAPREKGQGLHFLRTFFSSVGLERTGDLGAVADAIGDDPGTVSRHYAHGSASGRDRVFDAVDAAIRGA